MPKFYTAYGEKPPRIEQSSGNRWEPHFVEKYDEYGQPYLVRDGETDTYSEIQSYKESCDIHYLLERYANGDISVMSRAGQYMDISGIPGTWHDIFNTLQAQRENFEQLPLAIKEKFGHSFEQWAAQAGSEDWMKNMGFLKEQKAAGEESKAE